MLLLLGWHDPALERGVARFAAEAHWALEFTYVREGFVPPGWKGDGIVALVTNPRDVAALRPFRGLPLVDLSMEWVTRLPARLRAGGRRVPRVLSDNRAIGDCAAKHFLDRGYRHIAFLNYGDHWMERERRAGFLAAVEAGDGSYHELERYRRFDPTHPRPRQTALSAHRWLMRELKRLPKPLAVFATSDDIATHVFRACAEAGLEVPRAVAILGCNNEPTICDYTDVPLSSVDSNLELHGYEGARLLDRLMNGQPAPADPILIPPMGVMTRQSTDLLAVPHPGVAKALHCIRTRFADSLGVPDVARASGMSRRGLELAFRKCLGHSIGQEIESCRIEKARRLLLETDRKMAQIAEECGFTNHVHFSQAFNRVAGIRPSAFRCQRPGRCGL